VTSTARFASSATPTVAARSVRPLARSSSFDFRRTAPDAEQSAFDYSVTGEAYDNGLVTWTVTFSPASAERVGTSIRLAFNRQVSVTFACVAKRALAGGRGGN
jgi:hypothetical protein